MTKMPLFANAAMMNADLSYLGKWRKGSAAGEGRQAE
jgi:hypothetical protein